jgi:hypothetical protein
MGKNKLQYLFDCLPKDQKKRFPGWLKNELQGQRNEMYQWFEQVWAGKSDEEGWENLHPDKPYDQSSINSWNTLLIKWVEEYLAFGAFRKNDFVKLHFLNRAIIRSNPLEVYPSSIRKSRRYLEKQPVRDRTFYQIQHELDRLDVEFQNSYPGTQIRRYEFDTDSYRKNEEMALLLANMEMAVRRLSFNEPLTEWDQYCVKQIHIYLENDPPEEWPVAFLYASIFDYLQPGAIIPPEEAKALVRFFQAHFSTLRSDAQYSVGILISNTFIRSFFRKQDDSVIELALEVNNWILNRAQVHVARYFYRNIIQLNVLRAQRTEELEERKRYLEMAYEVLENLKEKLPAEEREEVYLFNLADLHFESGNFAALAKQIYAQNFKDYAYQINYLILWNKAQYEIGDYYGMIERLKSLQVSLKQTHKLRPDFKKRQWNQVKYFLKMLTNYRPSMLRRLKKQLEEENTIIGKKWLLAKLEEKIALQERK